MSAQGDPSLIRPLRVRDIPAFLRAIEPIVREWQGEGGIDLVGALTRHAERLIEATAIGAEVDREWLEAQDADTLVALAARVLEVNADFFVRRVLPRLDQAAAAITTAISAAGSVAPNLDTSRPGGGASG